MKRMLVCGIVLAIAFCSLTAAIADFPKEMVVSVTAVERARIQTLEQMRLTLERRADSEFQFRVTQQEFNALVLGGFNPVVLIEDVEEYYRKYVKGNKAYEEYTDYSEMIALLDTFAATYPDLVMLETVGESLEGRDLVVMKISDNAGIDENEPEIYFDGATHGDEIQTPESILYLARHLLENYGIDDTVTELVDNREIWLHAMMNPDGREAIRRTNSNGVDPNRDYGYMWHGDGGSPGPFSQPENQGVRYVLESNHFTFGTSYHSGTLFFSYPWSYHYDDTLDEDLFDVLGEAYTDYTGYPYNQGSEGMYTMNGSSKDTFYGVNGTLGWTIEIGNSKTPPYSTGMQECELNLDPQLNLIEMAGQGITGVVTDADTDDAIPATIKISGRWYCYNDSEVGDFHRFLTPGTYDVEICANGYECASFNDVVVVEDQQTDLSVALDPEGIPNNYAYKFIYSYMPNDNDTHTLSIHALGPPDNQYVSIGNGGYVILDMGADCALGNGTGNDVIVWEGDATDEEFYLYGANVWNGPWTMIGTGVGTSEFDFEGTGLSSVRYFKIVDTNKGKAGEYDGFDLDALGGPAILIAMFDADPTSGDSPLEVHFENMSVGNPTSYYWEFGDGDTSVQSDPVHTYTIADDYDVSLTVTSSLGSDIYEIEDFIHVTWGAPGANFSADPIAGVAPLSVDFVDFSTGSITSWAWDFGDGGTSADQHPTHEYAEPGNYTVSLEVTGPGGSDTREKEDFITVRCPAPETDFEGEPTAGQAPLTVSFTSMVTALEGCTSGYAWNFGDGTTSSDENPEHVFEQAGTYTVQLTVTGPGGSDRETKENYIEVSGTGDDDDDDTGDDDSSDDDDDDDSGGCF